MYAGEVKWIRELNSMTNGYNMSIGGPGGDNYANNPNIDNIKKKISESVRKSDRWTDEKKSIESVKMKGDRNPMKDPKISRALRDGLDLSRNDCKNWWVYFNKDNGSFVGIEDKVSVMGFESRRISMSIRRNVTVYGYKWKKYSKNEITKEELQEKYGKSL
jgi:hypothetical protein